MSIHMHLRSFAFFLACVGVAAAQAPDGRVSFQARCAVCHGTDGNGGEHAPSILARVQSQTEQELIALLREGVPARGMPAFNDVPEPELRALAGFLRTMVAPGRGGRGGRGFLTRMKIQLTDGQTTKRHFWTQKGSEYPLLLMLLAIAIFFRGGGKYSIDHLIGKEL